LSEVRILFLKRGEFLEEVVEGVGIIGSANTIEDFRVSGGDGWG